MSGILLALLAAVCWGSIVLVGNKLGGDAYSQTLGTTVGALIFSIVIYFFTTPSLSLSIFIIGMISGFLWSIGQRNQFSAVKYLGVSKTVPLSTGMQLVATSLTGVLVFKEWSTTVTVIIGVIAIALIITGVIMTTVEDKKQKDREENQQTKRGLLILLLSTAGYLGYVVIIRWYEVDGWSAILPQAIGMMIGGLLLTFRHNPFNKYAVRNSITGLIWAAGNLGLLLSLPKIGVATSFSLSQTGIIISTLGGIFLLGEKKSKRQMTFVVAGSVLIIIGGVMIGFTKQ